MAENKKKQESKFGRVFVWKWSPVAETRGFSVLCPIPRLKAASSIFITHISLIKNGSVSLFEAVCCIYPFTEVGFIA